MTTELQNLLDALTRGEITGEQAFVIMEARRVALLEQSTAQQQRHMDAMLHQSERQTLALEAIALAISEVI